MSRLSVYIIPESVKLITEKIRFRGLSRGTFPQKSPLTRSPQRAKHFLLPRSARGELKNSPVDCFSRGDALQERASPTNGSLKCTPPPRGGANAPVG